ncbi:MAG: glycosyltransferase [Methyloprofundus sp.]|nr:glycosyltransferase [Methyloprofundus sp.]
MKNWQLKEPPVVSVCCTTYNHKDYISEAIEGFLIQETDFPFEIIIRDDCSADKTAEIVKQYAEKYPNIIKPIYETENQFSKGVKPMPVVYKKAVGKYFALCEGDDYWTDPLKLQKQVDFLENNDDYVITYTDVEAFDENGNIDGYVGGATRDLESVELQKAFAINTLTACFRNVIKELPPEFQCTQFGDLFLWSLLGAYGKGKFLKDIKPARYRMHDGGIFSKQKPKKIFEMQHLTNLSLYAYYLRTKDIYLSQFFYRNSIYYSFLLYGVFYHMVTVIRITITRLKNFIYL